MLENRKIHLSGCCRTYNCDCLTCERPEDTPELCPFCAADVNSPIQGETACRNCIQRIQNSTDGLQFNTTVSEKDFKTYLDYFLNDNPNEFCSKVNIPDLKVTITSRKDHFENRSLTNQSLQNWVT